MYFSVLTFILEIWNAFLQITSSVLGNLLDVVEEVQAANVELQNLTYMNFHSPSGSYTASFVTFLLPRCIHSKLHFRIYSLLGQQLKSPGFRESDAFRNSSMP